MYEVDQLLLGTILFTLAAFLFPTVLAYYLAFAAVRHTFVFFGVFFELTPAFAPCLESLGDCRHACGDGDGGSIHEPFPFVCSHASI